MQMPSRIISWPSWLCCSASYSSSHSASVNTNFIWAICIAFPWPVDLSLSWTAGWSHHTRSNLGRWLAQVACKVHYWALSFSHSDFYSWIVVRYFKGLGTRHTLWSKCSNLLVASHRPQKYAHYSISNQLDISNNLCVSVWCRLSVVKSMWVIPHWYAADRF